VDEINKRFLSLNALEILFDLRFPEPSARPVPDVKNFYSPLSFQDAVDHSINMRLVTMKQMPERTIFRRRGAAIGKFFQTENGLLETAVPAPGRLGVWSIDVFVQLGEVSLSARTDAN